MKTHYLAAYLLLFASLSVAQTVTGIPASQPGDQMNRQFRRERLTEKKNAQTQATVLPGDRVVPQFVDGDSWKTSMFFINLETHSVSFQVLFFDDAGNDMTVPIVGQGPVRGLNISLEAAGSITFESTGTASTLTQGWALLSQSTNDSVGGMAIFRQSVFGREQEAVVPIVSQYNNHFVLLFDNTNFTTAIALANPTDSDVVIPVNIRNQAGQIIDQSMVRLGSYNHAAFALVDTFPSTAGRRGSIEFLTSGFGVGALGLRFSGSAFTSFPVFETVN